jgi:D-alanyl-D-alanine carboxypeptidase
MGLLPAGTRLTRRGRVVFTVLAVLVVAVLVWGLAAATSGGPPLPDRATGEPTSPTGPSTPTSSPTPTEDPVPPLPECRYGREPAPASALKDWARTLLDTTFALPEDYRPQFLRPVSDAGFENAPAVLEVRSFLIDDLGALREAAEAAGNPVDVAAAYRSWDAQASLFEQRVEELGRNVALRRVARPGHSEHQLGTSVDFKTAGEVDVHTGWQRTPAGAWMAENAHRFGFVLSYPRDSREATCYSYEPWHFRYLGPELAQEVHDSGLTLREFLWQQLHADGTLPA